ncbi:GNAT family N-acetyltransferase [Vibrio panuliri]|uniref:GNAT family N-acetyltransferase n=1 Tax=Vibrio panuliri TaxID=1381081 RepID=A0A1Q9HNF2_9VIBR|nr:GNAT family N-acetyltransferase [Vibrio panuliri]KAB1457723.1 GNAT family N-acetyltransferase [Vibrio panuliri]OLQ85794.1 GNAT family N-acetyltransferase [Vibrio panuliri]OLQ92347.1 GNAT family N-acetyltransferase [Vibrio panuliri]
MEIKELQSVFGYEIDLRDLLIDSVAHNASIGFVLPIENSEADDYWLGVEADLREGGRKLYVAFDQEQLVGAVQLSLCSKSNGTHRGEVEKLIVKTSHRGQGIAKQLMSLIESESPLLGVSLLVLDTRKGDIASFLYRNLGYQEVGEIPLFARNPNGELESTIYFYKQLALS